MGILLRHITTIIKINKPATKYFTMKKNVFFLLIMVLPLMGFCQQSIFGPACVLSGFTYQYDFKLNRDGIKQMNVCVTGGAIESQSSNCLPNTSLQYVRINWNSNIDKGIISISYGSSTDSFIVFVTTPLSPGIIDTTKKVQTLLNAVIPKQINCSAPTGGNCKPIYSYQWQQSNDCQNWQNINGANDQNISFNSIPAQTTFYRRKTIESKSHAIAYSEPALIVILAANVRAGNQ